MEELKKQVVVKYRDPVCKEWADEFSSQVLITYNNMNYYFCSIKCAKIFESSPEKYLQSHCMQEPNISSIQNNTDGKKMDQVNMAFMDNHMKRKCYH